MKLYEQLPNPITAWAEADRPREKLMIKGKTALSDAELIAILIGSGSKNESAVELSKRILKDADNKLGKLGKLDFRELQEYIGIGEAKAISIVAALELTRRRKAEEPVKREKISSSKDVFTIFEPMLSDLFQEEFWVLFLNRANKIISKEMISSGGFSGTIADPRVIFSKALSAKASGLILVHNHPSGNTNPSQSDITLTKKLKSGGSLIDIPILDHLIIAEHNYYSFVDNGIF